jgi:phosphohistidine phosphatase
MKLHLLRHCKTETITSTGKDFDRKLMPKGVAQSKLLAEFFNQQTFDDCLYFSSSSARTRETVTRTFSKTIQKEVQYKDELYLASAADLVQFVNSLGATSEVFIIGHNEGLSDLVHYLTEEPIELQTGDYISIQFDVENSSMISAGTGIKAEYFHPTPIKN